MIDKKHILLVVFAHPHKYVEQTLYNIVSDGVIDIQLACKPLFPIS